MRLRALKLAATSLAAVSITGVTCGAAAQTLPSEETQTQGADPGADSQPQDVVVTGSRGLPRSIADSPTPIDVIAPEDLQRTGQPGVLAALNLLVPSFNVPNRAGGGTSTIIRTGGLRGLNPDQTLILVNGKRRHKTSLINAVSTFYNGSVPADLDLIPVPAVGRIEVLRDGAAAQYGSDAIAGVVNLILDNSTDGGAIGFTAGQNFDRSDGENYLVQINYGMPMGDGGHLNLFADAKKQDISNRAIPISPTIDLYRRLPGNVRDPREATIDRLVTISYGNYPVEAFNLGYNLSHPIGVGGLDFYSFGTFSQRHSDLVFTFRAPNNANSLPEVYPNGFRPLLQIIEEDYEFAAGFRGKLAGWDFDLSTTYGRNRSRQEAENTINASLGPTSPTEFYVGALVSTEWVNSLDFTRGFAVGKNLQVSAGLQHRRETYAVQQGEPLSYAAGTYTYVVNGVTIRPAPGGQAAAGFTPDDAGSIARNNFAAYADVAWDPTERTTIGAAVRFETYDDESGDTLIGKINGRQEFTDWLSVRAAAQTGFRAPALAQQIYASTTGQFRTVAGVLELLQIKTLPVNSAAAIALGAQPLTPETSVNFSAGVVLTPIDRLTITVDAYQIDVDDRIAITSTLTGTAVSNILRANGLPSEISAQYYTNAIDTRTRGIDVVATYNHRVADIARMNWNVSWNFNETKIRRIGANPPELAALGAGFVLFDRLSQSNLTVNLPRTKFLIANTTSVGDFTLSTRVNRFGSFKNFQNRTNAAPAPPVFANDREFGPKWITDLELSWNASDRLELAIGANNLFNVYPDYNDTGLNVNLGQGFYATTGAYGFTGGSYYGRLRLKI
jgi:iron complex outermembrane receptor protein